MLHSKFILHFLFNTLAIVNKSTTICSMPSEITEVRVFLSSPSDVPEERNAVYKVANELSELLRKLDVPVCFRIYSSNEIVPDVAETAQAVIDRDMPEDFDALVAVFNTRIGTPTGGYPSGTAREIATALELREKQEDHPRIICYFCNSPTIPRNHDADQTTALAAYRTTLEKDEGALTDEYQSLEEFREKILTALCRLAGDHIKSTKDEDKRTDPVTAESIIEKSPMSSFFRAIQSDGDDSPLSGEAAFEYCCDQIVKSSTQYCATLDKNGKKTTKLARELEALSLNPTEHKQQKAISKIQNYISMLNEWRDLTLSHTVLLDFYRSNIIDYLIQMIIVGLDRGLIDDESMGTLLTMLQTLEANLNSACIQIERGAESISSLGNALDLIAEPCRQLSATVHDYLRQQRLFSSQLRDLQAMLVFTP